MTFQLGDRVRLIRPHTYNGRLYDLEAVVGDIGIVTSFEDDDIVIVEWVPELHHGAAWCTESAVDENCLGPDVPTIHEDPDEVSWMSAIAS